MFSEITSARWVGAILVERLFPSGALRLTRDGSTGLYLGYTVREALAQYRAEHPARRLGANV